MAATAVLKNQKIAIYRPRFEIKLKREVELLQYGGLCFTVLKLVLCDTTP